MGLNFYFYFFAICYWIQIKYYLFYNFAFLLNSFTQKMYEKSIYYYQRISMNSFNNAFHLSSELCCEGCYKLRFYIFLLSAKNKGVKIREQRPI